MLRAKEIFELDTEGSRVFIKEKEDKEALKIKYGKMLTILVEFVSKDNLISYSFSFYLMRIVVFVGG